MGLDANKQPFNREYRKIIKAHRKRGILSEAVRNSEDWTATDSPLRDGGAYGSLSFQNAFRHVLREGYEDLGKDVEDELSERKGKAVFLEYGGPGTTASAGFSKGFFKKTAGISILDSALNLGSHTVISGDILSNKTQREVLQWLGNDRPDLIIERMQAGLAMNPGNHTVLYHTFKKMYEILNEGGIMLIQVPRRAYDVTSLWAHMLTRNFGDVIKTSLWPSESEYHKVTPLGKSQSDTVILRLRKLPGAPAKLPMLEISNQKRKVQNKEEIDR